MTAIVLSVILGLIVNECSDVCPWCARKLIEWSAHRRYTDPGQARVKAEELAALIDNHPGKLLKLLSALSFAGSAILIEWRRDRAQRRTSVGMRERALPRRLLEVALDALPDSARFYIAAEWKAELAGITRGGGRYREQLFYATSMILAAWRMRLDRHRWL